jgi:NADH-quinone oxidoreductase subunit L
MTDIKRVLAYSTISQLGLMMTALGLGAASAAMFHLSTHAFFKALLFLAAGSVIHATHRQDLRDLGGLGRDLPWTHALFLIAALSMGGFPLLSGFWSKDAILVAAREHAPWLMWMLIGGAAMTAGYIFRLYLRCFHGARPDVSGHHPLHESPAVMILPMAALGCGAVGVGFAGPSVWQVHEGVEMSILLSSSLALVCGVALAFLVGFQRRTWLPATLRPLGTRLYRLAANKYYVDEAYQRWLIEPFLAATDWLAQFDRQIIDGAVDAAGWGGWMIGQWKERFDRVVVDGLVNGVADVAGSLGRVVRIAQTGVVHHYLFWVVTAATALMLWVRAVSAH